MRRREFIGLTAGLLVWPLPALAQEKTTAPTIGFLHGGTLSPYATLVAAFRDGMNQSGYVEGQNVTIEYRWAENQLGRLPELAADLVRHQVSVIFAGGGPSPCLAAKGATSTIPIVFANGVDPVEVGLVDSLNRPGGNVTGITFLNITLGSKRLEVLRELVPNVRTVAALLNPKIATADAQSKDIDAAARTLGLQTHLIHASTEQDFDGVSASLLQLRADGLVIGGADPFFFSRCNQLVELATRISVPTIYPWREAVVAGGLVSYGGNGVDPYRLAGSYAGRILRGDKPADLPVQQVTKVELVINLKTAKALDLTVPPSLLARADEVIE